MLSTNIIVLNQNHADGATGGGKIKSIVAFEYLMRLKGQVLRWTFPSRESKRNESDYSGELGKRFTKQPVKLHIHLGDQMKEKMTKDFPYGSQSSRMLCSVRYSL